MSRRFGDAYRYSYSRRLNCGRRVNRSTRRCKLSFVIGDSFYYGKTRVTLLRQPNTRLFGRVLFRIHRLNEYCVWALKKSRSQCTKTYRGQRRFR